MCANVATIMRKEIHLMSTFVRINRLSNGFKFSFFRHHKHTFWEMKICPDVPEFFGSVRKLSETFEEMWVLFALG